MRLNALQSVCARVFVFETIFDLLFYSTLVTFICSPRLACSGDAAALIVLGTTLSVQSSWRIVLDAAQRRLPLLVVNRGVTKVDTHAAQLGDANVTRCHVDLETLFQNVE